MALDPLLFALPALVVFYAMTVKYHHRLHLIVIVEWGSEKHLMYDLGYLLHVSPPLPVRTLQATDSCAAL